LKPGKDSYRLLIEHLPDAFAYHQIILDDHGKPVDYIFLEINSAFEYMTGLSREEVIGKKVTEVHPGIINSSFDWVNVYGQLALGSAAVRFEHYFEPAGRWYDVSAYSDKSGYFAVVFRDISESKKTEQALLESEGKYRVLFNAFPLGITVSDQYGKIIESNDLSVRLLGITKDEHEIRRIDGVEWRIIRPDGTTMPPDEYASVRALKENRLIENIEMGIEKPDTEITWINVTAAPIPLENYGITVAYGNITKRKEAENALQTRERFLDNILQTTIDGFWVVDNQKRITQVNDAYCTMSGYNREELLSMTINDLDAVEIPEETSARSKRIVENGSELFETYHRRKDSSIFLAEISATYLSDNNGQFICFCRDITERKRAENALAERLTFENIISRISSNFINLPLEQIDDGINYALKSMGEFLQVDRTYLYHFSEDGKTYSITHIWCRDGVEGYFEKDQNFPVEQTPWWISELKSGRHVNIADVSQLPEESALDRADFLSEGIKSLFTLPLTWEGEVFGCFGFDTVYKNRVWTEEQVGLLQVVTELISGAIARHDANRQIRILSFHDQLTGLYNRRYFKNELERLDQSREHPIAVISADLDGLKLINDTIGHSEGDRYLQTGADLLKNSLHTSDILARVGGDEFALLLPRTDKVAAELLVNRIRRRLEHYNLKQKRLPLSISLGLAVSVSTDYPLEEIYRLADNNMYTDKLQQGKKARAEIVSSLLSSLFERGNLAEGERDQVQELAIR
jgi:diguanylate cyclase (GGDEF)-like protein/PAS domain S-box-containing protein